MLRLLLLVLCLSGPAVAQVTTPGLPLAPLGYCQLTSLSAATALSACPGAWNSGAGGIPPGANAVVLRSETQAVRYTDDGVVTPTASVGMTVLVTDAPVFYQGALGNLLFIEETSSAKLDVLFYKAPQ